MKKKNGNRSYLGWALLFIILAVSELSVGVVNFVNGETWEGFRDMVNVVGSLAFALLNYYIYQLKEEIDSLKENKQ